MKNIHIAAQVRQRGAIGSYYSQYFTIQMEVFELEAAKDQWFAEYGAAWELSSFVHIQVDGELKYHHCWNAFQFDKDSRTFKSFYPVEQK